jgi:uncharacterized protein
VPGSRNSLPARHPLLSFFVLSYSIMSAVTFIYLAGVALPYPLVWFLQVFSPSISAVILCGFLGGQSAIRGLLAGFTRWRVGLRWYLAALFLALGPLAIAGVYIALGNPPRGLDPSLTPLVLMGNLIFTLASGPLSEEAGWRGFALPRLQERYSAAKSSVILGVVWCCWHIPLYFMPDSSQRGIPFPIYLLLVVLLAVFFTWIYNNTRGSLVLTALSHFCFNFSGSFIAGFLGLLPPMMLQIGAGSGLLIAVIIIVVVFGPEQLSRKPPSDLPFRRHPAQARVVSHAS